MSEELFASIFPRMLPCTCNNGGGYGCVCEARNGPKWADLLGNLYDRDADGTFHAASAPVFFWEASP